MDNNNPTQTIAYFLAKDMLEHMDSWRKRIYRLRKNAKNFLVYKGEPDTYITKEYPQGVDVPVEVVEGIWHEVRIGNVVVNEVDEQRFAICWHESFEDLEKGAQMTIFTQLVYWIFDCYGEEAQKATILKGCSKECRRGYFTWEGRHISIPTSIVKKVVSAIDQGDLYVKDGDGNRTICCAHAPNYFLEEIWGKVA